MNIALLVTSHAELAVAEKILAAMPSSRLFLHESMAMTKGEGDFASLGEKTAELFDKYDALVFLTPAVEAVRAISPLVARKAGTPAIIVVDVGGHWAVSLSPGADDGGNKLADRISAVLAAAPEDPPEYDPGRTLIVGIDCSPEVPSATIVSAIEGALDMVDASGKDVRFIASVEDEAKRARFEDVAMKFGRPLRLIAPDLIANWKLEFGAGQAEAGGGEPGSTVELSALLSGRKTKLILTQTRIMDVLVAISREHAISYRILVES